ncbi:MAG: hypothetical protein ABI411_14190, partial [Tahibacter sp.]
MNNVIRCWVSLSLLALAIGPAAAATPIDKSLPLLCKRLQERGWGAPEDVLHTGRTEQVEFYVPGVMYMCTLEHPQQGVGAGRAPQLQALLGDSGDGASVIFSASVWCDADRAATLDALAGQIVTAMHDVATTVPAQTLAAIRAGKPSEVTADTLEFGTSPIAVDPNACANVAKDSFGAVLMKIDV